MEAARILGKFLDIETLHEWSTKEDSPYNSGTTYETLVSKLKDTNFGTKVAVIKSFQVYIQIYGKEDPNSKLAISQLLALTKEQIEEVASTASMVLLKLEVIQDTQLIKSMLIYQKNPNTRKEAAELIGQAIAKGPRILSLFIRAVTGSCSTKELTEEKEKLQRKLVDNLKGTRFNEETKLLIAQSLALIPKDFPAESGESNTDSSNSRSSIRLSATIPNNSTPGSHQYHNHEDKVEDDNPTDTNTPVHQPGTPTAYRN